MADKNKKIYRLESDSFGALKVPEEKFYGAQTARSLINFNIGTEKFPAEFIHAYAIIKLCSANANYKLKVLSKRKKDLIVKACKDILDGKLNNHFPLSIWQTGSGTQTNMNLNEVIANQAIYYAKGKLGSKSPVHPNDDVNKSQSTNDSFPAAMHVACILSLFNNLLPALDKTLKILKSKTKEFKKNVKIGRTHLMDATPLTAGQEFSAFTRQIENGIARIRTTLPRLFELPLGGTAVGTGINTPKHFDKTVVAEIKNFTKKAFKVANNKFEIISAHDAICELSGALKTIASSLNKIANDIRFLSSGPRCGIGEYLIPENEPGSSIMPGKVNPTQCEAISMIAAQVMGNDVTINFAASNGHFQLNAYKPVLIYNILQSISIMSDGIKSFNEKCLKGIKINKEKVDDNLNNSLMLVTAFNPYIGYDNAAKVAKFAFKNNISIKEAVLKLNLMDADKIDKILKPENMI